MGISCVIIMLWQGHRFKAVKEAAWEDVTQEELKLLNELGVVEIGEGDELTQGGFILLGLLRMGQDVGVIKYLADAHISIEDRGGVIIRTASDANNGGGSTGYYSKHAQHYVSDSQDEVADMLGFTSQVSDVSTKSGVSTLSAASSKASTVAASSKASTISTGSKRDAPSKASTVATIASRRDASIVVHGCQSRFRLLS